MSWLLTNGLTEALKRASGAFYHLSNVTPINNMHNSWQKTLDEVQIISNQEHEATEQQALNVLEHLLHIIALISTEHLDEMSPCKEYLVEKQIIAQICDFGCKNQLFGMATALEFFAALFASPSSLNLLPTRHVHLSIGQILTQAVSSTDAAVQEFYVELLYRIWTHLNTDPFQLEFFQDQNIFTGLLPYIDQENSNLGDHARQALLIAVSIQLPPDQAAELLQALLTTVITAIQDPTAKSKLILAVRFSAAVAISAFSSFLDLFLREFQQQVLDKTLRPQLLSTAELQAKQATDSIRVMVEALGGVSSHMSPLLALMIEFLLHSREDEVTSELISRINSISEDLSISTLDLFSTLLELNDQKVWKKLVLSEASSRGSTEPKIVLEKFCAQFNGTDRIHNIGVDYLKDGHCAVMTRKYASSNWTTETDVVAPLSNPSSAHESQDITSIGFIPVLWKRTERFLESSMKSNLLVTEILSQIAQCSDRRIDELVFSLKNPHSLNAILVERWEEAVKTKNQMKEGELQLDRMRLAVKSNEILYDRTQQSVVFFQAYIVLEEFILELTAILIGRLELLRVPLEPEGHYMSPRQQQQRANSPVKQKQPPSPVVEPVEIDFDHIYS